MTIRLIWLLAVLGLAGCDFRVNVNTTDPNAGSLGTNAHEIYISTNTVSFETNVIITIPGKYRIRWGVKDL